MKLSFNSAADGPRTMLRQSERGKHLIARIEKAFPDDKSLPRLWFEGDRGKTWTEYKEKPIRGLTTSFVEISNVSGLEIPVFHAYLPIILIACAFHFHEYKVSRIFSNLVWISAPPWDSPSKVSRFYERFQGLDVDKIQTLLTFFEFMQEEHGDDATTKPVSAAIQAMKGLLEERNLR